VRRYFKESVILEGPVKRYA